MPDVTNEPHEPVGEEAWYDAEIVAPLNEIAKKCQERGVAFVAGVFYGGDEAVGITRVLPDPSPMTARWAHYAMQTHRNIDALFNAIRRDAEEHNVNMASSVYAYLLGWLKEKIA